MSHFSVLVIGDDVESQLAPYHEYECTDLNDEYVQDIDITEQVLANVSKYAEEAESEDSSPLQRGLEWEGLENWIVSDLSEVEIQGEHRYGYAIVRDGELVKAVKRTNPNAKWDWWVLGGRWTGYLKLKEGASGEVGSPGLLTKPATPGYADSALKGEIDWEGKQNERGHEAGELWDKVRSVAPEGWESWDSCRERFSDVDDARTFYHNQSGLKAAREVEELRWIEDNVLVDRDLYVNRARNSAYTTYAIIKDGEWISRGDMGWFGISSNEVDYDEWLSQVNKLLAELPDDTLISVVDCHI
jgi:hypothetical protein